MATAGAGAIVKVSTVMAGSRWVSASTVATVRPVVRSTAARIAGTRAGSNACRRAVTASLWPWSTSTRSASESSIRSTQIATSSYDDGRDALTGTSVGGGADAGHLVEISDAARVWLTAVPRARWMCREGPSVRHHWVPLTRSPAIRGSTTVASRLPTGRSGAQRLAGSPALTPSPSLRRVRRRTPAPGENRALASG